jgi:hypothetical protein
MKLARESATVADLPTVREAVAALATPKEPPVVTVVEEDEEECPWDGRIRVYSPRYSEEELAGASHLPDVVAEDAHENLRTVALRWFEWGLDVKELLNGSAPLKAKSEADRKAIRDRAKVMAKVARDLERVAESSALRE